MYLDSLNAIRALLKNSVPSVTTVYVDDVPANFEQPSFFIEHVHSGSEDLNFTYMQFNIQWQLVYFPPRLKSGIPDRMNQLEMAEQLRGIFTAQPYLMSPTGRVYLIDSYDGGPRGDELYISIRLHTQLQREKPTYETMQQMHLKEE
ncbi:phage tail terminator family protein [Paenibacillus whitsoniae]|uniref:Uncharacterized protein n=1 Tax=Paenibacillus whitsoniae TaxID=2496558 RepID=A0A430J7L0_9BACL|nr:hypothetical protein [Paenibacillus whitsoniae]RTE05491.1 hypothetical protein EJQ19_25040 [Paenibacillus whitsoniae]